MSNIIEARYFSQSIGGKLNDVTPVTPYTRAYMHVCIHLNRAHLLCNLFKYQAAHERVLSTHIGADAVMSCRCSVVTVTEHGAHRFFFVFTAFQWLQCSQQAMYRSRSTLGTVVIVVSTSKRLVSERPPSTVAFPRYFFAIPSENAVTRVPPSLFGVYASGSTAALSFHLCFLPVSSRRNLSPINIIMRGRLPLCGTFSLGEKDA